MRRSALSRRDVLVGMAALSAHAGSARAAEAALLNASYDPTRELYRAINRAFMAAWKARTGDTIRVSQSHGGSGAQTRAVLDGLQADVVTLALAADIDALARRGLIAANWATRLPDNSCPFTSTIVLLTRKANPKQVTDWPDLLKPGLSVITPNPKTSGGARWNFLAALGWAQAQPGATPATAEAFMRGLFKQVPVLDTGARGATNSFVQRELGDVLIAWENEAWLVKQEFGADAYQIVYPSVSVRAEPPVAVVDAVVDRKGTRAAAEAYLAFLYTPEGQEIGARNFYRPHDPAIAKQFAGHFPDLKMMTVQQMGGWETLQQSLFGDGGMFDRIYGPGK